VRPLIGSYKTIDGQQAFPLTHPEAERGLYIRDEILSQKPLTNSWQVPLGTAGLYGHFYDLAGRTWEVRI
jgi:hypothetical protein